MNKESLKSPSSIEVDVSQIAETAVYHALSPVSFGLGILYLIFGISHFFLLPPHIATVMGISALGTAVVLFLFHLFLKQFALPAKWAYPVAFTIYTLVLVNSVLHLYLADEPHQSTNVMLTFIGAAFFFLNQRWFMLAASSTVVSWVAAMFLLSPSPDKLHFGFAMGAAVVFGLLIRRTRWNTLLHVERLRLHSERQSLALETAVYNTQQQLIARQQSDEKFSKAFQLNPLAMSITTLENGRYVDVNDSFLQLFGFTRSEVIGHTSIQLNIWISVSDRHKFAQALQANGSVMDMPFTGCTKTGDQIDILIYAETLEAGGETFILSLIYNITQQKQAEIALRESEQQLRQLYNTSQRQRLELELMEQVHVALAQELDLSTLIRTVVEATASIFGYPLVSLYLLDDNILHLQHQVGYSEVIAQIPIDSGVSGRVIRTQKPILVKDSRDDPEFLHAMDEISSEVCVPLFDAGQVAGMISVERVSESLTEEDLRLMVSLSEQVNVAISRARLHTQIRISEEHHRSLVEQLPIGVCRILPIEPRRLLMVNPAFVKMFGFADEQEALTILASDFYTNLSDYWDVVDFLSLHGQIRNFEVSLKKQDGDLLWGTVTAQLIRDDDGIPLYIDATIEDITERKKTEEMLRQTQKLESLGILAGGIAHDFNNLLVAVMAQNDLALVRLEPQHRARGHIEKALKAAKRAADLTQKMLAYSGKGQFQIKVISLNDLIEENIHLFEVAVPKQITLSMQLSPNLPKIDADAVQIQQVIMNLIMNGVEAMEEASGVLQVKTYIEHVTNEVAHSWYIPTNPLPPDTYVVLDVHDDGVGMDVETIKKIFDPFFTTKFTGRGLGLAAVLGIIHGHNGNLKVDSRLGDGTTFKVYFPISYKKGTDKLQMIMEPLLFQETNVTVLVIDDDAHVRETVADILETIQVDTIMATNGLEGIRRFSEKQDVVKLIILDLSMPGLSGEETLVRLKQINDDVPIVLSSGYNQAELIQKIPDLANVGFLQKPYNIQDLSRLVQEYVV